MWYVIEAKVSLEEAPLVCIYIIPHLLFMSGGGMCKKGALNLDGDEWYIASIIAFCSLGFL